MASRRTQQHSSPLDHQQHAQVQRPVQTALQPVSQPQPKRELSTTLKRFQQQQGTLNRKLKSQTAKSFSALQIGIQEVICHLTQVRLSTSSRSVVFGNSEMPDNRLRRKKKEDTSHDQQDHMIFPRRTQRALYEQIFTTSTHELLSMDATL